VKTAAEDRSSAAGGVLTRPRKAAFKLRIAALVSLPWTVSGIEPNVSFGAGMRLSAESYPRFEPTNAQNQSCDTRRLLVWPKLMQKSE
jgi:hypothetical protein